MSDESAKPVEIPSAQSVSPRCPLCGGTQATSIDSLTPAEIQIAWRTVGVPVSTAALGDLAQADRVHHWRCPNCLFEYSDPNYAGGAKFYGELQTALPRYYPSEALEFARALAFARAYKLSDVLDVGCGAGAFLNLAKSAGLRTHGIELNPKAAAIAEAGGHVIYSQLLHEIIAAAGGKQPRFSLVTAWQVLEHVPDPGAFLRDCAQFVKAGGYLAVAVPTEAGINRLCPYNPHLWPPHHITRWRLAHLR